MIASRMKIKIKNDLKHRLLNLANIRHLHIVGCSRSGTTMLHYSFAAFQNTLLFNKETTPWGYPGISDTAQLFIDNFPNRAPAFVVTKRPRGWYLEACLHRLAGYVQKYNVFLLNIVRDPRDVLTSSHSLSPSAYYVDPDFWRSSIAAAEFLFQKLQDYPYKLTVRFEDVVRHPDVVENRFQEWFGLIKKPQVKSMARLRENVELCGFADSKMIDYMHKLRDFDASAIGKWQHDPAKAEYVSFLLNHSIYRYDLIDFFEKYGYIDDVLTSVKCNAKL